MSAAKLPSPYAERVATIEAELADVRAREAALIKQRESVYAEHAAAGATFKPGDYVRRNPSAWRGEGPVLKVMRVEGKAVTVPRQIDWTSPVRSAPERVLASRVYTCRTVTASGQARGAEVRLTDTDEDGYKAVPAPRVTS